MPHKNRHSKSSQDNHPAFIAVFDTAPDCHRCRKPKRLAKMYIYLVKI